MRNDIAMRLRELIAGEYFDSQTEGPVRDAAAEIERLRAYADDLKRRNATHVGRLAGLNSTIARQRTEIARLKAEATLAKQRRRSWWSKLFRKG